MANVENVIIIWSGPAGHTAAIYAGRAMLEPLMFEWFLAGGVAAWGQLTTTTEIENFPWFPTGIEGTELMMNMRQQSLNSWCRIETKTVDAVELSDDVSKQAHKVIVGNDIYETKTIIIATGATAKRLWLDGEEKYRQRGVSACAVCDGGLPIFRDKHLVVIGGGDSACEEAHYLTKFASKVSMLVRRDELRASKVMQERVMDHKKIDILRNTNGGEILGDGEVMTWLKVKNNKTEEEKILEVSGLFYAIGHKPNTDFLWGKVTLDEAGYIITKDNITETNIPGVFAAGDVQDKKYRQAITSAGTGCMAALEAEHFLQSL